jgi:hypothetical protein
LISGPAVPDKYVPASHMNESLGKITIYDVSTLDTQVGGINYARVTFIKSDGTKGILATNSKMDTITETITFDFSQMLVDQQKGINIAFVEEVQILHAII